MLKCQLLENVTKKFKHRKLTEELLFLDKDYVNYQVCSNQKMALRLNRLKPVWTIIGHFAPRIFD